MVQATSGRMASIWIWWARGSARRMVVDACRRATERSSSRSSAPGLPEDISRWKERSRKNWKSGRPAASTNQSRGLDASRHNFTML